VHPVFRRDWIHAVDSLIETLAHRLYFGRIASDVRFSRPGPVGLILGGNAAADLAIVVIGAAEPALVRPSKRGFVILLFTGAAVIVIFIIDVCAPENLSRAMPPHRPTEPC
jgi:hypothetical protein